MNDDLQYTERTKMIRAITIRNASEVRAREVAEVHGRHLDEIVAQARKKVLDSRVDLVDDGGEE